MRNVLLWIIIVIVCCVSVGTAVLRFVDSNDVEFVVENKTFTATSGIEFDSISIGSDFIAFNEIGFEIESGSYLDIQITEIENNLILSQDDTIVLQFDAQESGGQVNFLLSGFPENFEYRIEKDGSLITTKLVDDSGVLSFSEAVSGSGDQFTITQVNSPQQDVTSPVFNAQQIETSDVLDLDSEYGWENFSCTILDESEILIVNLVVFNESGIHGNYSMNLLDSNTYYYNLSIEKSSNYSYYVYAVDVFSNSATSEESMFSLPENWDINEDGYCSLLDLLALSNMYGQEGNDGWVREDVNNDGVVSVLDFAAVSNYFDQCWYEV